MYVNPNKNLEPSSLKENLNNFSEKKNFRESVNDVNQPILSDEYISNKEQMQGGDTFYHPKRSIGGQMYAKINRSGGQNIEKDIKNTVAEMDSDVDVIMDMDEKFNNITNTKGKQEKSLGIAIQLNNEIFANDKPLWNKADRKNDKEGDDLKPNGMTSATCTSILICDKEHIHARECYRFVMEQAKSLNAKGSRLDFSA